MLTLTDAAVAAIRDVLADKDVLAEGGLRISTATPPNGEDHPTFELAVVAAPEPTDTVVERDGVHVYLETEAVPAFADTVLDARLDDTGVSFTFVPTV